MLRGRLDFTELISRQCFGETGVVVLVCMALFAVVGVLLANPTGLKQVLTGGPVLQLERRDGSSTRP